MNKKVRVIAASLALAGLLSACSSEASSLANIKAESMATEAEIIDYYSEALSYDTIAKRTTEVNRVVYETTDVSKVTYDSLVAASKEIQTELGAEDWSDTFHVSKYQHQYIKYLLDDKQATLMKCTSVNSALGYFFVDFEYNLAPQGSAKFTSDSKYVGISGAYKRDASGNIGIDDSFMAVANMRVLDYCQENGVTPGTQTIPDGDSATPRKSYYDISLYNSVAGSSITQSAFMPPIKMVIAPAPAGANLSGYGMYPQGKFGMAKFGYDRTKLNGKMTLRYVFKQNLVSPSELDFISVYCVDYTLNNRLDNMGALVEREKTAETDENTADSGAEVSENVVDSNNVTEEVRVGDTNPIVTVPKFARSEVAKVLERYDRAICNGDLEALLGGNIFDDVGIGYLNGFYRTSCYGKRYMSKVVDFLAKNGNTYLIDVESTIQDSPIGTNQTGTYVQKAYMTVEQSGVDFEITDYVIYDFCMKGEPQLDVDSNIMKQLAALNIQGEVPEKEKENICSLLGRLYDASTKRYIDLMYACFNSDTTILSSKQYEYLNSQLRSWLVKMGVDTPAKYRGQVTEWLGGSESQAELITEELITYEGKDTAQYMQMYYLVSDYDGKWVIDDMQVIESENITAAEGQTIAARLADYTVEVESNKEIEKDFGALTLSAVVTTEQIDGVTVPEEGTQPSAPEEGAGENNEQPVDNGSGGETYAAENQGQYVWSEKLQDWVWQAG